MQLKVQTQVYIKSGGGRTAAASTNMIETVASIVLFTFLLPIVSPKTHTVVVKRTTKPPKKIALRNSATS